MSKSVSVTVRLPAKVAERVERLAEKLTTTPADTASLLIEEALRARDYPHIDFRDTAAGRVAYIAGTRFAVYWVFQTVRDGMSPDMFAHAYDIPLERVRMAFAYAHAFQDEIKPDIQAAEANWNWILEQDSAARRRLRA